MTFLSSAGAWFAFVVVSAILSVAGCVTLALLAKILAAPERDVRVQVRLVPWPRIDIDAKARGRNR